MKRLITAAIAVLALAMLPASALAKDRNHDRIPDKWEKRHHLSLKHNQARKDQDHDGLRNLAEYKDRTNPRDADTDNDGLDDGEDVATGHDPTDDDSDNDGVEDGQENGGTVKSFDGTTLVISLAKGGDITGVVNGDTELECNTGDDQGDDKGENVGDHSAQDSGDSQGEDQGGDSNDSGGDRTARTSSDGGSCSSTALSTGAVVKEAELEVANGQAVWHSVKLLG